MSAATYSLSPFGRAGTSYLAPDLTVRGRIETSGSVEMDCEFHGDVLARQAIVGPNGRVRARISADEATVSGEMTGIVNARQAFFRDGCHFRGEVEYESLGTEPQADVDARLIPVMAGSSRPAIPTVHDVPVAPTPLPRAVAAAQPPRLNLSMVAFLGGMIVAGVITGILVINPTTRGWKDQLLEQVMQPRPDAIPPAPTVPAPVTTATGIAEEAPRITPPPPPAVPPSLSKMIPGPAVPAPTVPASAAATPAVNTVETRSAQDTAAAVAIAPTTLSAPVTPATPAPAAPVVPAALPTPTPSAPVAAAPSAVPDLSPSPPLLPHEPVDKPILLDAATSATVAPPPTSQPAATPVSAAAAAPDAATKTAAPPSVTAPSAKASPTETKPEAGGAKPDTAAKSVAPTPSDTQQPAATPLPAAGAKKTKTQPLPAGARGALQEVCTWELKCDSDNQCISVRSCKVQ